MPRVKYIRAAISNRSNNVEQKFRVPGQRIQAGLREKQVKNDNKNTCNLSSQDLCDL